MTINREQLISLAADELNVTAVGQTLAQEDYEKIDSAVDGLLSNLAARGIVYLSDADTIPDSVSDQLAILLADVCSKSFGKPRDFALRDRVEEEIRVIVRRRPATNKYLVTDPALEGGAHFNESRWTNGN